MFTRVSYDRSSHFVPEKESVATDSFFECNYCDDTDYFESESNLIAHRRKHHRDTLIDGDGNAKTNNCLLCVDEFDSKDSLISHMKTDHLYTSTNSARVQRELFVCDVCERIYFSKSLLILHMIRQHSAKKKSKIIRCMLCKRFLRKQSLFLHCVTLHQLRKTTTCLICVKNYSNKALLSKHMKSHPKRYFCFMCGSETTYESIYNEHVRSHKTEPKSITTPLRAKITAIETLEVIRYFTRPSNYKALKGKHSDGGFILPKPFHICVLCMEICYTDQDMYIHLKCDHAPKKIVPVIKKKFVCECGESFDLKVLLTHHRFKAKCELSNQNKTEMDI